MPKAASPYKLRIHKWAGTVKLNIAMMMVSQAAAVRARETFELVRMFREKKIESLFPEPPPLADWLNLYRDHRRLTWAVADFLPELFESGGAAQRKLDTARAISAWAKNRPEEVAEWLKEAGPAKLKRWVFLCWRKGQREYKRHLIGLAKELALDLDAPVSKEEYERFEKALRTPEIAFYFRVCIPCLAAYQAFPIALLWRAGRPGPRQAESIERLVRIDDRAIYLEPVIRWRDEVGGEQRSYCQISCMTS